MTQLTENQQLWLEQTLKETLEREVPEYSLTPLNGDASSRQYYTLSCADIQFIVVIAEHQCNLRFAYMTHRFDTAEARVPYLFAMQTRAEKVADEMVSCMLLSLVGSSDLLHALQQKKARTKMLYMQAITQIYQWQAIDGTEELYDEATYALESNLFVQWFVPHLGHNKHALEEAYHALATELFPLLCKQPYALAHRDYHSRNILINEQDNNRLYTVDYQDAIRAPLAYDLVSLLKDVYIDVGDDFRHDMCKYFYEHLPEAQQTQKLKGFIQDFELVGIQRHLKIAGIFVRLYMRDGKPAYLDHIPLCLDYLQKACANANLESAQGMAQLLEKEKAHLVDAIAQLKQSK